MFANATSAFIPAPSVSPCILGFFQYLAVLLWTTTEQHSIKKCPFSRPSRSHASESPAGRCEWERFLCSSARPQQQGG
ncbi:g8856 [Coccomyxa viridis]|uniref:G8856 protein n=1 Tax=Coccomyxa viridis TaxID=1274662 RepID=A0ABP1G686_9CHLO